MSQSNNIVIIGAGLAGSLLSIYLARRGYCVTVYEARGDMRKEAPRSRRTPVPCCGCPRGPASSGCP
ncbi:NAD(P)-binding protein [Leptolyngbya sp. 15MV]|nr:NAD(P)-binding protein [Leptolyngbya sp. 15MV]